MRWIIDGYNVILADHKLSKLMKNSLELARDELAQEIRRSGRFRGQRVTIIFDGRHSSSAERIAENLEIRFSPPRETADDLIKKEIGAQPGRRSLFVVSNDHAIINYARECGARVIKSGEFLSLVREPKHGKDTSNDSSAEKPAANDKPDPELLRLFIGEKNEK